MADTHKSHRGTALRILTLLLVGLFAGPVWADGNNTAAGAQDYDALSIRSDNREVKFRVKNPAAAVSAAWVDDEAWVAGQSAGVLSSHAVYELTSRIIVRAEAFEQLNPILEKYPHLSVKRVAVGEHYWLLKAANVGEAAAIAAELSETGEFDDVSIDMTRPRSLRDVPDDPYFNQQWHLYNDIEPLFDVNAEAAWDLGYTGAGIVVGIIEDAWDHEHIDLAANFNPEASETGGVVTSHATACAGIVGEVAYNGLMGAGVAYGAQIAGQTYGTDAEVAEALTFRNDLNDIKTNSWGPPDGSSIDYMPAVVQAALEDGIAHGRGGLGEIYVWAAGNGNPTDRVEYDPYASSRYTIAVGAIGDQDVHSSYSEVGSSLLVVAHSHGNDRYISTTTRYNTWTTHFGGTSAASPLAAGVVALMLEANPRLTWRDVQHVLVNSARKCQPEAASWQTNGGGHDINYDYGFGAVDAGAAVVVAESWENVAHEVTIEADLDVNLEIPDNDPNGVTVTLDVDENIRIESVELIPYVETTNIGNLEILLTSPAGTNSLLAKQRGGDSHDNYDGYIFTSVRHWDEVSAGTWSIRIADRFAGDLATWQGYRLLIHGTPTCPGDLVSDGMIDLTDVLALLESYSLCDGDEGFNPAGDFDNSGCITLSDLAYLLSVYGEGCD